MHVGPQVDVEGVAAVSQGVATPHGQVYIALPVDVEVAHLGPYEPELAIHIVMECLSLGAAQRTANGEVVLHVFMVEYGVGCGIYQRQGVGVEAMRAVERDAALCPSVEALAQRYPKRVAQL